MAFVEVKKSRQIQLSGGDTAIVIIGLTTHGTHGFAIGDLYGSDTGARGRRAFKILTKPEQPVPGICFHEIVYVGLRAY